jgi:hypothetical protein
MQGKRPMEAAMTRRANHDLVDIAGEIRAQTEKAVQLFDGKMLVWLPRSQIEVNDDGTVTMPEWLAIERGLV